MVANMPALIRSRHFGSKVLIAQQQLLVNERGYICQQGRRSDYDRSVPSLFLRMRRDAGQRQLPCLQLDHKQNVLRRQTAPGEHLGCEEVHGWEHRQVCGDEILPCGRRTPDLSRFGIYDKDNQLGQTMLYRWYNRVTEIGRRSLN
jgi:hypothetical protein